MKYIMRFLVVMCILISIAAVTTPAPVAAFSGSGSGTASDPYQITNVSQLQEMKDNLSAHYILMNDIDATATATWNGGHGFVPIGNENNPFTGSFDGQGHTIYNLYINWPDNENVGLLGYISTSAVVENVGLENVWMSGNDNVGGLVGVNDWGTVSNSYSIGSVNGNDNVGGLVGCNIGTVSNSYSIVSVNGNDRVGGLVGVNDWGTVSNCYSTGSVSGYERVGGLVGMNDYGTVSNSYSAGSVSGGGWGVGGLVGYSYGVAAFNSFWDVETSGKTSSSGGTGKTTKNMKNVRTYTDNTWSAGLGAPWDFVGNPYGDTGNENIWNIDPFLNNGYPFLTELIDNTAPPAPSLIWPENNENILDNTPTFQWTSVTDPTGVTYQIQIDDNSDFSSPVYFVINLTGNTHTLPNENALELFVRYFWRVRAKDGMGNIGPWSEEWNFTVVPIGAIGALLMPLVLLLPFALVLWRRNKRCNY